MENPAVRETILIVDDESDLAWMAAEFLEDLGYVTRCAADAADALRFLEEGPVDLLFSDVLMPGGLDGFELADRALARQPGLKVLLCSGDEGGAKARALRESSHRVLSKPYRIDELAVVIRQTLDG